MTPDQTIKVGERSYPIVFNTAASYNLEIYLQKNNLGTVGGLFKRLVDGSAGFTEVLQLLWASIEGGRVRNRTRLEPYTIEEVAGIVDEMGGLVAIAATKALIIQSINAAAPLEDALGGGAGPNAQTRRARTGRRSSKKQR